MKSTRRSARSRAEVTADYLADREEAHAAVGEDSGASFYAAHRNRDTPTRLAGRNKSAQ
jgi:hypothetical protein